MRFPPAFLPSSDRRFGSFHFNSAFLRFVEQHWPSFAQDVIAGAAPGPPALSKGAYSHFFDLWREAHPDIPILREAKAEFAKLQ
jgi:hypothetical protein